MKFSNARYDYYKATKYEKVNANIIIITNHNDDKQFDEINSIVKKSKRMTEQLLPTT